MKLNLILGFIVGLIIYLRPYLRYRSRNENNKVSFFSFYYIKRLVWQEKLCFFFYKGEGNQKLIKLHNILTVIMYVLIVVAFILFNFFYKYLNL